MDYILRLRALKNENYNNTILTNSIILFGAKGSHLSHMHPIGAANGILLLRDIVIQPLYPYRFGQLDSYLVFRMKVLLQQYLCRKIM